MNLAKGPARFALAVALLALMVGPMLFSASSALAQVPSPPSNYYGYLDAGSTVTASIGEAECGSAEADADGLWFIVIDADNECNPVEGDEISFAIDGDAAEQTVAYTPGWAPADVATGMALTVAAMPAMPDPVVVDDTDAMDDDAMDDDAMDDDAMDDDAMDDDAMDDDAMDDDAMDDDAMTTPTPPWSPTPATPVS